MQEVWNGMVDMKKRDWEQVERGKGKLVHVCPECGEAEGWSGGTDVPGLSCIKCGHKVTWAEWANLPTIERYGYAVYKRRQM